MFLCVCVCVRVCVSACARAYARTFVCLGLFCHSVCRFVCRSVGLPVVYFSILLSLLPVFLAGFKLGGRTNQRIVGPKNRGTERKLHAPLSYTNKADRPANSRERWAGALMEVRSPFLIVCDGHTDGHTDRQSGL